MAEQHTSSYPVPTLCDAPQRSTKELATKRRIRHKIKSFIRKRFCALCAFLWLNFLCGLTDLNCAALNDFRVDAAQAHLFSEL